MIKSKKISLMLIALTAATTFSSNCFAMKKKNSKLIKPILVGFKNNIKQNSNNAKNNNIFKNKNNIKLPEKKENNKPIQKNELEQKIKSAEIFKSENLKNNINNNKLIMPQFMPLSNLNNNYIKNNIKLLEKKRNLENQSKQNMLDIKKNIFKTKNYFNINKNENINKNPFEYVNLNNLEGKNLNEKLLIYKNELNEKINKLNTTKNEIEKSMANNPIDILNNQMLTYDETLNDIKNFSDRFKAEIINKANKENKQEYEEEVNKTLINDISEILKNFEKTYSNFFKNDYEEVDLNNVKDDMLKKLNKPTDTIKNENILNNYNDETATAKEDFKDLIVMKIFKEELKKEYIKCINPFLLKTINKTLKDYKEIYVVKMPVQHINDENKYRSKKYRIDVSFPYDLENSFENSGNDFDKFYHYLISNEKIIFGNAVINTIKKLREAGRLNICLYKNTYIIKNKTNSILNKRDIDEAYNEINNINITTPCYKRLVNFYNWLYIKTLGIRKKNDIYKSSIMYSMLGKHLYDKTFEIEGKTIKIRDFSIDAKYNPNLEIYEQNNVTENINKENNEQQTKV